MKIKKRIKGLAVCMALCLTMLCGGVMVSHATAPCEPNDHNWCKVRDAGIWEVGTENVTIGGHLYKLTYYYDMQLERCYCGKERVVPVGKRKTHQEFIK